MHSNCYITLNVQISSCCVYFQSTEVKNSNAMELESLKRQISFLETNGVEISKLVTDRHTQVAKHMANEKPTIEHAYDVWHIAKGNSHQNVLYTI